MADPEKAWSMAVHKLSEDRPSLAPALSMMNATLFALLGNHDQSAVDQDGLRRGNRTPSAEGEQHENVEASSTTTRLVDDFSIQGAADPPPTPTAKVSDVLVSSANRAEDVAESVDTVLEQKSKSVEEESEGGEGEVLEKDAGDVQNHREHIVEEAKKESDGKKKKMESSESQVTHKSHATKEIKTEPEDPLQEKAVEVFTSLGKLIAKANQLPSNDSVRQIISFLFMDLLPSETFIGCLRSRKDVGMEQLSAAAIEENFAEIKNFLQRYSKELNLNEMKEQLEPEEAFQKVTGLFQRSSKDIGLDWIFVAPKREEADDHESPSPSPNSSTRASKPAHSTSIASLNGNERASEDGALVNDIFADYDKDLLEEPSDPVLHENVQVLPGENIVCEDEVTTTEEKSSSDGPADIAPSNESIPVVSQVEEEVGAALPHSDVSEQQLTQLDPLVVKMFNAMMEERKKEPPLISSRKESGGKLSFTWVKTDADPVQNESSVLPSFKGVYLVESNDNVADGREEWNRMFSDDEGTERGVNTMGEKVAGQREGEVEKTAAKATEEGVERDDAVVQEMSGGANVVGTVGGMQEEVGEEKEHMKERGEKEAEISKKKEAEIEDAPHQVQKSERLGARMKTKKVYGYDETNDPLGLFARNEVEEVHPVHTLSDSPFHSPFEEEMAEIPGNLVVKQELPTEGDAMIVKKQHEEVLQKKKKQHSTEDRHVQKVVSNAVHCAAPPPRIPRKPKSRKSDAVSEVNDIYGIFVRAPEQVRPVYYLDETPPRCPSREDADSLDFEDDVDSGDTQPADHSQDNIFPVGENEAAGDDSSGKVPLTNTEKNGCEGQDATKSISLAEEGEKEARDDRSGDIPPANCQEDDFDAGQSVISTDAAIPTGNGISEEVERVIDTLRDPRHLDDSAFEKLLECVSIPRPPKPPIITLSDYEDDAKIVLSYVHLLASMKNVKREEVDDQSGQGAESADGEEVNDVIVPSEESPKKKAKKKVRISLPPKFVKTPRMQRPPIMLYDTRGTRFLSTEIEERRQTEGTKWFVDTASVLAALSSSEEEETKVQLKRETKKRKKMAVIEEKKKEVKEEGEGKVPVKGAQRKEAVKDKPLPSALTKKESEEMKKKKQEPESEMKRRKKDDEGSDEKEESVKEKPLPSSVAKKDKESEEKKENAEMLGKEVKQECEMEKDQRPIPRGRGRPRKRAPPRNEDEENSPKRAKTDVAAEKKRRGRPRRSDAALKPSSSFSTTSDAGNKRSKNVSPAPASATTNQPSSSKSPKPLSVDRPMALNDMPMKDILRIQKPVLLAPRRLSSDHFESRVALYVEPSLGSIKIPTIGMPYQLRPTDSVWPSIRCCAVLYVLKDEQHLKDKNLPDDIPLVFIHTKNASAPRLDFPKDQKMPKDLEKLLRNLITKL